MERGEYSKRKEAERKRRGKEEGGKVLIYLTFVVYFKKP